MTTSDSLGFWAIMIINSVGTGSQTQIDLLSLTIPNI